jgi:hypothetical protein
MRKRCIAACRTGVWQVFARHDVTFKKDSLRRGTTLASRGPTHPAAGGESSSCLTQPRLVFVDKTGPSTNLLRLRGRVIRGEGPVDSILHGRWKTITLLAGLHHDAIVASFVIDGPLDGKIFRTDVERCLPRFTAATSSSRITLQLINSPA